MAIKKVPVDDAVGMVIPHDLTEIVRGEKKGPAFRKGHVITEADIPHLKRIGKNHIYVIELSEDEMHEDEAALFMARAISGPFISYDEKPSEGKVGFRAATRGVLKVDRQALFEFNMLGEVMIATLHEDTVVSEGMAVAAGRAIPLVIRRSVVERAASIARDAGGIVSVAPFKIKKAGIVVTGREVYEGRIKDAFGPVMREKLVGMGLEVAYSAMAPDDVDLISGEIKKAMDAGVELILCTGGMSVDPDDVTRLAIAKAGGKDVVYGSPVLPGAMFLVAYIGDMPVLGVPACGMYFKATVLDLVLPRVMAGERIDRTAMAALGHGGLCLNCKRCRYPVCPFGKG
ncbi:MAG: molybdopterin-binding protein [Dissulfurimicrobium sp.]|uniref:molybdopterin-binding protein n=1 Tax=Dissulfurimicrobium TaxID=1769732 RepID=UPI001EDC61F8|nr:molybdopterin-binding protein [Dissulfurimicrobium hydrothermale]UKL13642.1 molybdopterin-binding protein [Dissulfurimicrobium hydrothermale]